MGGGGIVADAREHFLAAGRLGCYWPPLNLIKEGRPESDREFEHFPEVPTDQCVCLLTH